MQFDLYDAVALVIVIPNHPVPIEVEITSASVDFMSV